MPRSDSEQLVVTLEARIRDFEKKFEKANKTASKNFNAIEGRAARHTKRLNASFAKIGSGKILNGLTTVLKGSLIGGLLSVGGAIAGAQNALASFDKTAKAAKLTGLNSDLYQSLVYGAELAGLSIGDLDSGLQTFRRNSALAAAGQGTLYTQMSKVNPELLKQITSATTQEQKLKVVSDALNKAATNTDKVALATAAFGRNGQALIPVLDGGADGLDAMERKATSLGIVIDRDLLSRAEELSDELATATKVMNVQFSAALIDLAPILVDVARIAGSVAAGIRDITDSMRDLGGKSTRTLKRDLAAINQTIADRQDPSKRGLIHFEMSGAPTIAEQQAEADKIMGELKRRTLETMRPQLDALNEQYTTGPTDIGTITKPTTGTGNRSNAASAALKEADAVKTLIAELQREFDLIGATDAERRVSEELRRAGSEATADQAIKIRELVLAIEAETAAHESSKEAIEARKHSMQYLAESGVNALTGVLNGTLSLTDAFKQLGEQIAQAALQAALFGQGPLAGLFGGGSGILGNLLGLSTGGPVKAATGGLIRGAGTGTSDSIPAMLSDGEFVVNANATRKHSRLLAAINADQVQGFSTGGMVGASPMKHPSFSGNSSGQNISINAPITVAGSAGSPEQNDDLARKMRKQMERTMRGVVADEMRKQGRPGGMLRK